MTEVKVRGASLETRSVKVSRALLKQLRTLRGCQAPFWLKKEVEGKELPDCELNPETTVGWFHGSVLGSEYSKYILHSYGGDAYISEVGSKPPAWCKQLYI